jgi:hypothetical protein
LGVNVEFVVLRQKLDLDAFARLAPGLVEKMLFEARQASLGRSHQILHGRVGGAHLSENILGRHAAVHHPHAPRLAVLALDRVEECAQRLAVGGVAGQDLIGDRQALGGDDEGSAIRT